MYSVYVLTHQFPFVVLLRDCARHVPHACVNAGIVVHHSFANILSHEPNFYFSKKKNDGVQKTHLQERFMHVHEKCVCAE